MASPRSPSELLHLLRIKGVASADALAGAAGTTEDEVAAQLAQLASSGLVEWRDGALPGWRLCPIGEKADDDALAEEGEAEGFRQTMAGVHRRFLELNGEVLAVCTDWQLVGARGPAPAPNDHGDERYDAEVIARLGDLHRQAEDLLETLISLAGRFGHYRRRLQAAVQRVQAGERDWFTRPLLDSVHQVWFELHQDLLLTLGIDRGDEEAGARRVGEGLDRERGAGPG